MIMIKPVKWKKVILQKKKEKFSRAEMSGVDERRSIAVSILM